MAKEQTKPKRSGAGKGGFLANEKKSKKDDVPIGFAKIQKYNKMRLPDGTHKRKVDKIKTTLIQKAKAKQQYVKLLAREKKKQEAEERPEHLGPAPIPAETYEPAAAAAETEMHPDRLIRNENLDRQADAPERPERRERTRPPRRSNPGYAAEQQKAEQKRLEQEAREKEILAKEKAKRIAVQERNRKKKLMTAKSVDGRKQLGKQSSVLLSKIQQQMST